MAIYNRILIPTDGSNTAMAAVEVGLDIAQRFHAHATIISILDLRALVSVHQGIGVPDMYAYQQESADAAAEAALKLAEAKGVQASSIVRRGEPATDIIQESGQYDLIVMATHGRHGVSHFVMGSVAEKVVRFAACPVMVIRSHSK
ncbi:MAG: universal stress protein [Candidatus Saccharibacteria bacterium]